MKKRLDIILFIVFVCSTQMQAKNKYLPAAQKLYFIENKGQIKDQYGNPRKDIQYSLQARGITIFVGNGALHYQFSKRDICSSADNTWPDPIERDGYLPVKNKSTFAERADIETCRMDVELSGANMGATVIAEDQQAYYENYYLQGCSANGVHAHTFKKITYKNVYPDIDWVICIKGEKLEHEFVVRPGGDVSNIKLKYNGQTSVKINEDGSITASTPMGVINEQAPVCYSVDGGIISSSFKLQQNILTYNVDNNKNGLVIDPVLEWGTYYGPDTSITFFAGVACDDSANVYACGTTYSTVIGTIATAGAFQTVLAGVSDGFMVKFDSSGNRLWGTYYGGDSGTTLANVISLDHIGNIYLAGQTNSDGAITTPGTQEPTYIGGEWEGFLAKFSTGGIREWGTYIGGTNAPQFDIEITSVCFDNYGHVYVSGECDDTDNVATPGSHKYIKTDGVNIYDCFLQQYNTSGIRKWGTYYGGTGNDVIGATCSDGVYVYLYGNSVADTGISTPGSYQPTLYDSTAEDAFIAKFDSSGNRLWGTYYGGEGQVAATRGIACDENNLYIYGSTNSDTNMASPGCYQPLRAGGFDAFLAKFSSLTGGRIWGTYYGGPGDELTSFGTIVLGDSSNIYIDGYTGSTTGIASPCVWQTTYGGGDYDAFLAKYNNSGVQQWATYFGGNGEDRGYSCAFDGKAIYLCGNTTSPDNIATPGSFLSVGGGGGADGYMQGFLAKFVDPIPETLSGVTHVCLDSTSVFSDNITGGMWSVSNTVIATINPSSGIFTSLGTGITTVTYTHSPGCYVTTQDTIIMCALKIPETSNIPGIAAYPNPAQNKLTVAFPGKICAVSISNLIGQAMYSDGYCIENEQVDISGFPAGIYFVLVTNSFTGQRTALKFVKE